MKNKENIKVFNLLAKNQMKPVCINSAPNLKYRYYIYIEFPQKEQDPVEIA